MRLRTREAAIVASVLIYFSGCTGPGKELPIQQGSSPSHPAPGTPTKPNWLKSDFQGKWFHITNRILSPDLETKQEKDLANSHVKENSVTSVSGYQIYE